MTNITYITTTMPDLRQSMLLSELVDRLAKESEDWKHPIQAQYADMFHDKIKSYIYNDHHQATMKDFATDIYKLVFDLYHLHNHADTIAYKLTSTIYGG